MSNKHYVSVNQYSKIRGCSVGVVQNAIKTERIKTHDVLGKKMINVAEANLDWEANTDPSFAERRQDKGANSEPDITRPQPTRKSNYPSFQESRAIREAYSARITKLEYEEKTTKLVELERIKEINFDIARRVRNAILNVPGNINAEVASEVDPHKCETIIYNALADALELATKGS